MATTTSGINLFRPTGRFVAERPDAPVATGDVLRGAAASGGQVTGPARILRRPEEPAVFQPGDILVCVTATPAWTPLLSIAAGIITETGGTLSSAAIAARECGMPAVVGVRDATSRIQDGQVLSIDGARGVVFL
jgi:pyruvate,water dikinase